ncbi:hypothetical protein B0H11DRAFT_1726973 [Mycena galericulata]|nr:hypothetical protein B0H11DRAFT_1726973 [Mycena galericulata]
MTNLTACSRALQITEIVNMICEEADPNSIYFPHDVLPSLARVSKIFSGPALDLIWREQTSLAPLIKCMPETVWEQRGDKDKTIYLRRPIMDVDIPRLLFYSVRVRSLDVPRYRSRLGNVHAEVLQALNMCLAPHTLMPRLSNLSWAPGKREFPFIHHFLGPCSRHLELELDDSNPALSLLPYIKASCPRILDATLGVKANPLTVRLISNAVCGWQHLQQLSVPNLDKAGFIHISQLPSLTSLTLDSAKDTLLYLSDFLSGTTFPTLTCLNITCDLPRFCVGFIKVISSRQFESLTITPLTNWTASSWKELFTTLRDCLDHNMLELIEISESDERNRLLDVTQYILSADTIRPLLAFRNLFNVSFQSFPGINVDDNFLEELAVAWPCLTSLEFSSDVFVSEAPRATLNCLIGFARHCRKLANLGIRMDSSEIPRFSQVPGSRISHRLNCLNVGTSPILSSRTAQAAAFISNLFPRLEYLFPYNAPALAEPFSAYVASWQSVSDMVPVFSSVRSQEEEFWTEIDEDSEEETD